MMQINHVANGLEEQFWRDVETLAEASDLFFGQLALTTDHFTADYLGWAYR